jgi:hypothetical protein
MSIASLKRIPDKIAAPGMRSTDGQDRVVEQATGWRHDRRVRITAAVALLVLGAAVLVWFLQAGRRRTRPSRWTACASRR